MRNESLTHAAQTESAAISTKPTSAHSAAASSPPSTSAASAAAPAA